jgi:hypothetical protein
MIVYPRMIITVMRMMKMIMKKYKRLMAISLERLIIKYMMIMLKLKTHIKVMDILPIIMMTTLRMMKIPSEKMFLVREAAYNLTV